MTSLKVFGYDHWKRKFFQKCHFFIKSDSILPKDYSGASKNILREVIGGSPWGLWGRDALGTHPDDRIIARIATDCRWGEEKVSDYD